MQIGETMKIKLNGITADTDLAFSEMTYQYAQACNYISEYIFSHDMNINSNLLSKKLYRTLRSEFGLKSQLAQSAIKTVTARYQTVDTQLKKSPYKFSVTENGRKKYYSFRRDMFWLQKPIRFTRSQADLVRNRDYSFVEEGNVLSINTLGNRVKIPFDVPEYMKKFFDDGWKFGTAKLVQLKGGWYLHISATREADEFSRDDIRHVVGIDRGVRFITTTYDDSQKTAFIRGKEIRKKRDSFDRVRAELQAKGTRSAKRALKRISGRENRWMSDVNHRISKALVNKYGKGTLFVLEDLEGISFEEQNQHGRKQTHDLRNWSFYDLETKLTYKANETGCHVIKVDPHCTSQRCPHCGTVLKENRNHDKHLYTCRHCGFTSNDDRVGAMNIYLLGTLWATGDESPSFKTVS